MRLGKRAFLLLPVAVLALVVAALPTVAFGDRGKDEFRARLLGVNEVPSINTEATGSVTLKLNSDNIQFELRYENLEGGNPLFAHIHVGERHTNGGVSVFFCGGGGKPACPASRSGTVTGTITNGDVVGPATAQGVTTLDDLKRMIRLGATYSNVHTPTFGSGEIRGQNKANNGNDGD